MRKTKKAIIPVVTLALVAAACGGDDEGDSGDDTEEDASASASEGADDDESADDESGDDEESMDDESGDDEESMDDESGDDEESMDEVDPADIAFDYGVTEDTIRVGLNADLSGAFAPLVTEITEGQEAFWEIVNDNGGIGGRMVETVVIDNAYDVPTHLSNYEEFSDESEEGVIFFSQSTGSPHTAATAEALVEDNLVAIPLSWYSGWADPAVGQNVMELYTSYCIEAMNGVEWLAGEKDATTVAIISFPGEYGQDGATGAKMAAEALGLEVVYDGEGAVVPGADQTPVITELLNAQPDIVWATTNPTTMAEIFGATYAQGLRAFWSGNSPTYNYRLLATEIGPALDELYYHSTYTALWGAIDSPGMTAMIEGMREKRPDALKSDTYIISWTEGMATQAVLELAASKGDLTRAGVVAAFNEVEVDFGGLAPDQRWFGEPNDFIVRESYLYDVVADNFDVSATVSDEGGTGFELAAGPYVGSVATDYVFDGPCFVG